MTLPILFEERMKELLQEEYSSFYHSLSKPFYNGLRVNTLKISPKEFMKISPFTIKRIPWIENGFYYDAKEQPAKHPYYFAGLYYIQEPSAMTPANLLPIEPGDKVLDLCAAPGGKSTELAAKLKGQGVLVANDISNSRAKALLKNIKLFGVKNSLILSEAPSKLENYFPGYFDKILVDAPCSGEGMFRKTPAIMKNWDQNGVSYYNNLQKEIISSAAKMLKPGGMILYSTCTFSPEENEGTIKYFLEEFPEFHIVNPLSFGRDDVSYEGFEGGRPEWVKGREELEKTIRLWPHKIKGEGHFIALLRKGNKMENKSHRKVEYANKTLDKLSKEGVDFINQLKFKISMEDIELFANKLYLVPKGMPDTKGLRILRKGLLLGEIKKNRFEPAQALASSLKMKEYPNIINLDPYDFNVIKYLKGETITIEGNYKNGLQLIGAGGFPLGWGKLNNNILKNKYLPGWRWM